MIPFPSTIFLYHYALYVPHHVKLFWNAAWVKPEPGGTKTAPVEYMDFCSNMQCLAFVCVSLIPPPPTVTSYFNDFFVIIYSFGPVKLLTFGSGSQTDWDILHRTTDKLLLCVCLAYSPQMVQMAFSSSEKLGLPTERHKAAAGFSQQGEFLTVIPRRLAFVLVYRSRQKQAEAGGVQVRRRLTVCIEFIQCFPPFHTLACVCVCVVVYFSLDMLTKSQRVFM